LGLADNLAAVETVAPTGGDIARDPEGSIKLLAQACRRTVERDGARAVILGGAGLAGLAARVQPHVDVPIICSTETGFAAVLAAAVSPPRKPAAGDLACRSVRRTGEVARNALISLVRDRRDLVSTGSFSR
jgi:allantoin racemase